MNWAHLTSIATLVSSLKDKADADFSIFLLLCFVAALGVAALVIGGALGIALIAARKAAARTGPERRSSARAAHAAAGRPLLILYASETGNSRELAVAAGAAAQRMALKVRVADMAAVTVKEASAAKDLLVIASTWGEGEPPQRSVDFHRTLMSANAPRFEGVNFAVLALGDRAYANFENFCRFGRAIDTRLAELGGSRMAERSDCDADYESQASQWLGAQLTRLGASDTHLAIDAGATSGLGSTSRAHAFDAIIAEKVNLNRAGSTTSNYHLSLTPDDIDIPYEPGDTIGLFPENDPELVSEILSLAGLSSNVALRDAMRSHYDITSLTMAQVQAYATFSADPEIAKIAASETLASDYLEGGRQLIDLMAAAPVKLNADQLTGLFRRLQPRLYSIASSRKATPGQIDLLVGAVAYDTFGRLHKGVASMYVAERCRTGDRLRVYFNPKPHFHLPPNPSTSMIMVGPGTGVAPFRGFLQERAALGARGRNWLFFGSRHRATDYLYDSEWQTLRKEGVLTRLDLAFSRDQAEKIYVQDRMWEARQELYDWLQRGASIYVCGARSMARDVDVMLHRIAADQGRLDEDGAQAWVDDLRRAARYLRDAY
ncbi:MAG: sulfite reductase flavoprotein subunit alpha [Hyphomicrobiaceae bacterium]